MPQILRFDHGFDQFKNRQARQNLAALCDAAKSRSEIGHAPDHAVTNSRFVADGADRCITMRDTDAERDVVAALEPCGHECGEALLHIKRHAYRANGWLFHNDRVIENHHHGIGRELFQRALVGVDQLAHFAVISTQQTHHLFGLRGVGKSSEAAQIEKHHGHFAPTSFQGIIQIAGDDALS